MFQALSLSKLFFLSLFGLWEGMLVTPNFTGVICWDRRAGTHITINYQLPDRIRHFQKC